MRDLCTSGAVGARTLEEANSLRSLLMDAGFADPDIDEIVTRKQMIEWRTNGTMPNGSGMTTEEFGRSLTLLASGLQFAHETDYNATRLKEAELRDEHVGKIPVKGQIEAGAEVEEIPKGGTGA